MKKKTDKICFIMEMRLMWELSENKQHLSNNISDNIKYYGKRVIKEDQMVWKVGSERLY